MNITFLIGNGFDLRLDMNTRYKDMYTGYIQSESRTDAIKRLNKMLQEDAPSGYDTWADFEIAMGKHARCFDSVDEYIECVRDFKRYMAAYLQIEQKSIIDRFYAYGMSRRDVEQEMMRSVREFYFGQDRNTVYRIDELKKAYKGNGRNFITFNYTKVLDYIISRVNTYSISEELGMPLHIHGSLDEDILLGVDNTDQIDNEGFRGSTKIQRAFVKPAFNKMYDEMRMNDALRMIENSQVICVYGLSLGESDLTWRTALFNG